MQLHFFWLQRRYGGAAELVAGLWTFDPLTCSGWDPWHLACFSFCTILDVVKVSKSQKHTFFKSIAQKTNEILDKILP